MNKLTRALGILALTLIPRIALAQSAGSDFTFKVPEDINRLPEHNAQLFGFSKSSNSAAGVLTPNQQDNQVSGVGKQWVIGRGVLEDLMLSSGAVTAYVVCADTSGTTNVNLADPTWDLLYPPILSTNTATMAFCGNTNGCRQPPPLIFRNGLYCWTGGTGAAGLRYIPVWRAKTD